MLARLPLYAGCPRALWCWTSAFSLVLDQSFHSSSRSSQGTLCGRGSLLRLRNMDSLMLELLLGTWSHWAVITNLFGSLSGAPPLVLICGVADLLVETRGTNFYPGLPLSASFPSPFLPDTKVFVEWLFPSLSCWAAGPRPEWMPTVWVTQPQGNWGCLPKGPESSAVPSVCALRLLPLRKG